MLINNKDVNGLIIGLLPPRTFMLMACLNSTWQKYMMGLPNNKLMRAYKGGKRNGIIYWAAKNRHLEFLEWYSSFYSALIIDHKRLMGVIAANGDLDILKWLYRKIRAGEAMREPDNDWTVICTDHPWNSIGQASGKQYRELPIVPEYLPELFRLSISVLKEMTYYTRHAHILDWLLEKGLLGTINLAMLQDVGLLTWWAENGGFTGQIKLNHIESVEVVEWWFSDWRVGGRDVGRDVGLESSQNGPEGAQNGPPNTPHDGPPRGSLARRGINYEINYEMIINGAAKSCNLALLDWFLARKDSLPGGKLPRIEYEPPYEDFGAISAWCIKTGVDAHFKFVYQDLPSLILIYEKTGVAGLNYTIYSEAVLYNVVSTCNMDVLCWWGGLAKSTVTMAGQNFIANGTKILMVASKLGHFAILDWWRESGLPVAPGKYLNYASKHSIRALEWWLKSGLPASYDEKATYNASKNGHVDILDWWFASEMEFKYGYKDIEVASKNGHVGVLEWWRLHTRGDFYPVGQKLELRYQSHAMRLAVVNCQIDVLEWWIKSGLPLKYNKGYPGSARLYLPYNRAKAIIMRMWLKKNGLEAP